MRPDLAALVMPDGEIRPTCVHCSTILLRKGMLKTVGATVVNNVSFVRYRLAPNTTMQECREAVAGEHKGRHPWPD